MVAANAGQIDHAQPGPMDESVLILQANHRSKAIWNGQIVMEPHSIFVDEDLKNAAKQVEDEMKSKMEGSLNPELLQQYAIVDRDADFENALQIGGKVPSVGLVSVKSSRNKIEKHGNQKESHKSGKKRSKDDDGSKSNKKKKS